ncbi:MAG: gliding motility-associated protein GldE [bacterium]|nr:gliding motility-associated protein GldE [Candidatus Minthenecus merdequi]
METHHFLRLHFIATTSYALSNMSFVSIIILLVILLFCSAFVSASEVAYFSLSPNQKEELDENGNSTSKLILELLDDPQYLLATILITNNFVNIAIIVLSSILIADIFDFTNNPWLGFFVETVTITFIILLIGEIMPKIFAKQHTMTMCRLSSRPISSLKTILKPFNYILVNSTDFLHKRLSHHHDSLSMDELSQALELTENTIEEDKDILHGIVNFGNLTAASVMTPRMEMITIPSTSSFDNVISCINEHEYSRIPILDKGSYDNIRGILYAKDLIPFIGKGSTFKWQTLIRQAYFVPETKKIDDLLQDFQKNRVHMAIVVDEFGGTSGLVTMEDVLEEVVGDISDEYDNETKLYSRIDDRTYLYEARIPLSDFIRSLDFDFDMFEEHLEDADTLAGLILNINGDFPELNEHVLFNNLDFEITELDARRILKVKLTLLDKPTENDKN